MHASPDVFLQGFSNPALITILGLMVIGHGISRTGVLDKMAHTFHEWTLGNVEKCYYMILGSIFTVSGFLNNTPLVVVFIPIMEALAKKNTRPSSSYMMPISFAAILGGMLTLIGSSTNLLVVGIYSQLSGNMIGFFDFFVPALFVGIVGLIYIVLFMPFLLPHSGNIQKTKHEAVPFKKHMHTYIAHIRVDSAYGWVGVSLQDVAKNDLKNLKILFVERGLKKIPFSSDPIILQENDYIHICASREQMEEKAASKLDFFKRNARKYGKEGSAMFEVLLREGTHINGKNVRSFEKSYDDKLYVIGIEKHNQNANINFRQMKLESGMILLIQGKKKLMDSFRHDRDIVPLEWSLAELPKLYHAKRAIVIFILTIGLAALGVLPIVASVMVGVIAIIATGVITVKEAYHAIDKNIIFLIVAALAFGQAIEISQGGLFLGEALSFIASTNAISVVLSFFFLFIVIIANILSSKAAAILAVPMAYSFCQELDTAVEPFIIAIIFAANCAFANPVAYQTNLLVMGTRGL